MYSPYEAEIGKKIEQLNWLIAKAQILNREALPGQGIESNFEAIYELEIVTETFYHFVGRLVELFKRNSNFCNIPKSNTEKVRHQLLQHPEKQKNRQKASFSFECGLKDGPKIKSYRGPEDALVDNGLFKNAQEFNEKLVYVFSQKH